MRHSEIMGMVHVVISDDDYFPYFSDWRLKIDWEAGGHGVGIL